MEDQMVNFGNALSNLDFDAPGKSNGFIDVNHPDNDHAFGSIRVPVGLINGRDGPTILLTAGNHGDEYEGQIILNHLMQQLTPD
jgi:predicted deacylase